MRRCGPRRRRRRTITSRSSFWGDAVLGLAIAHHLYETLPDRTPGEYSRMRAGVVSRGTLARIARENHIARAIRLGKGRGAVRRTAARGLGGGLYGGGDWRHISGQRLGCGAGLGWCAFSRKTWPKRAPRTMCGILSRGCKTYVRPNISACRASWWCARKGPDHKKEFEVEVFVRNAPARARTRFEQEGSRTMRRARRARSGRATFQLILGTGPGGAEEQMELKKRHEYRTIP